MFFKNASIYELDNFKLSLAEIDAKLLSKRFVALKDNDVLGGGFEHILFNDSEAVVHEVNNCFFFKYVKATRSVPKNQLNALVAKGIAKAEQVGKKITKKFKSDLTAIALAELLRVQPVKHVHIRAYIDVKRQLLIIDNASDVQSEGITAALRKAFGSFRCSAIGVEIAPCDYINDWISQLSADEFRIPVPKWLHVDFYGTIKARGDDAKKTLVSKGDTVPREAFKGLSITECDMYKVFDVDGDQNGAVLSFTLVSKPFCSVIKLTKINYGVNVETYGEEDDEYYNSQFYLITEELGTLIEDLSSTFGGRFGSSNENMITADIEAALAIADGKVISASELNEPEGEV